LVTVAELTRNYETSRQNYQSLLDKTLSAGMSQDLERRQQAERFIVLDTAKTPAKPVSQTDSHQSECTFFDILRTIKLGGQANVVSPLALWPGPPKLCGEKRSLAAKTIHPILRCQASSLEQSKLSASASPGLVFARNA
jgi:hypothetical protein